MLVFEWQTTLFEVVVEQHQISSRLRVERLPGEVIVDAGKFSCAATLLTDKKLQDFLPSFCTLRVAGFALLLGVTFGSLSGLTEASTWGLPLKLIEKFTPQ